jgi:pyruvate ferredoxin oxidoreductase gamma subunit
LQHDGYILINTGKRFAELGLAEFVAKFRPERLCTVLATELALKHIGRAAPNAPLRCWGLSPPRPASCVSRR